MLTRLQLGEQIQQAYDMYAAAAGNLKPAVPNNPGIPPGWVFFDWLQVTDKVLLWKEVSFAGYIITDGSEYRVLIRGTDNPLDMVKDLEAEMVEIAPGIKVERGFFEFFNALALVNHGLLLSAWLINRGIAVTWAGHSLGGAAAIIGAFTWWKVTGRRTACTTFAAPAVGNVEFKLAFEMAPIESDRVFNLHDVVPKLPPASLGFEQLSPSEPIDSEAIGTIKKNVECLHSLRTYLTVLGSTVYPPAPECAA